MKDAVSSELVLHADEEMAHAELLATGIIQLGGAPVLTPADWFKLTNCKYEAPADPFVQRRLVQPDRMCLRLKAVAAEFP